MNETTQVDRGETSATVLPEGFRPLNWRRALLLALVGIACFHAAYTPAKSGLLALGIIGYLVCLVQLAWLRTTRQCFYVGLAVGLACFAPQLECFWRIFGVGAVALWLILAFWIAVFIVLSHLALARLGTIGAALLAFAAGQTLGCDIAIDMESSASTIGPRCIGNLFNGMAVRTGGEQYGTARWQGGVD
jgi:hypothetical protein